MKPLEKNSKKRFRKIVCLDRTKLKSWALKELNHLAQEVVVYKDDPATEEVALSRAQDADAILVSWRTLIDKELIQACKDLKYIGMACSLYDNASANVAVDFARARGIVVKGIKDYGDPGVAEFIVSELIQLFHGFRDNQWREVPVELTGRKIGIIGLGATGQLLAKCLLPFGPELFYYSRTRKKEWEDQGLKYLPLRDLLRTVEVVSIHVPRNSICLGQEEFEQFGTGKIFVYTSLGLAFRPAAFLNWISRPGNFAIFDGDGKKELDASLERFSNVTGSEKSAGWTSKTQERLSQKVIKNLRDFLEELPD